MRDIEQSVKKLSTRLTSPVATGAAAAIDASHRQSVRLQRHRIATSTSLLVVAILFAAEQLRILPWSAFLWSSSAIALCVLAFYGMFRLGLNQRFKDPSLTLAQMIAAAAVIVCTMYFADGARASFLLLLLMVFLFGVLRFGTHVLLVYAGFILLSYGALIFLLWLNKRDSVNLPLEVLQWLTLAMALPWFVWMGGYIKGLRKQLQVRNADLGTALKKAQSSESDLAEAQTIARIGMWMIDPIARSVTWAPETFRLFGVDPGKDIPMGDDFLHLIHAEDQHTYNEMIRPALLEGKNFDNAFRVVDSDGRVRWLHALGRPVIDANGRTSMIRGTVRDITEQREADEHIRRLAHFDTLTGLPNRGLFTNLLIRALAQATRRGKALAVLFLDLDGFKAINDQLGHDAGDALLTAFAARLTGALRTSDLTARLNSPESAARLGGDEFVVLIDDFDDVSKVTVVARRILATVETPFRIGLHERKIGVSIGIALFPHDADSLDRLMKCADSAMYVAKHSGKNTYRFFSE